MTAVKNGNAYQNGKTTCDEVNQLANDGHDGDIDASDADTIDYKQRKREMIIQKQLERRQQQELRRMQLEEERARKAEELRQKEEELAMKKMVEKNRKETIFQAYIDKKKQSEIESMSGCFGPPNSLMNAKKFHSTNRLKPSTKSNTQNLFDPYDQASLYSERSANGQYSTNTMVKSKSKIFFLVCSVVFFEGYHSFFLLIFSWLYTTWTKKTHSKTVFFLKHNILIYFNLLQLTVLIIYTKLVLIKI